MQSPAAIIVLLLLHLLGIVAQGGDRSVPKLNSPGIYSPRPCSILAYQFPLTQTPSGAIRELGVLLRMGIISICLI